MGKTRLVDEEYVVLTMHDMKRRIKKICEACIKSGKIETIEIIGPPGVGKSKIVGALATELGMPEIDVRFGHFADSSEMVMKVLNLNHDAINEIVLARFPKVPNCLLRMDEFRHANDDVRKGTYQLLEDKCLGPYTVPAGTVMIGISNGSEDVPLEDLDNGLRDRFKFRVKVVPDFKDWCEYIAAKEYVQGPTIMAFLKYNQDLFFYKTSEGHILLTPRRWESIIQEAGDMELVEMMVHPACFIVLNQFVKKVDMFRNVKKFVSGELKVPDDIGDQWAIYAAIMSDLTVDVKYEDKCFEVFEEKMRGMDADIQCNTQLDVIRYYLTKKKVSLSDVLIKLPAPKKAILGAVVKKYQFAASGLVQTST